MENIGSTTIYQVRLIHIPGVVEVVTVVVIVAIFTFVVVLRVVFLKEPINED